MNTTATGSVIFNGMTRVNFSGSVESVSVATDGSGDAILIIRANKCDLGADQWFADLMTRRRELPDPPADTHGLVMKGF